MGGWAVTTFVIEIRSGTKMRHPPWLEHGKAHSAEILALLGQESSKREEANKITYNTAYLRGNIQKNRYCDVLANDQHRAVLPGDVYVNASVIEGLLWEGCNSKDDRQRWIASQGPLDNTLDDFLSLLVHPQEPDKEAPHIIIMLTAPFEAGREKCLDYVPGHQPNVNTTTTTNYTLSHKHTRKATTKKPWNLHTLVLGRNNPNGKEEDKVIKEVHHFEYIGWPDKGVPKNPSSLIELIDEVKDMNKKPNSNSNIPILVHCSAGIGRTGLLIALSELLPLIRNKDNINIDNPTPIAIDLTATSIEQQEKFVKQDPVAYTVNHIRHYRTGMVQTFNQLQLIYEILLKLL